jgi:hypothetical protein
MKTIKNLVLIILSLILLSSGALAQSTKKKSTKNKKVVATKPVVKPSPKPSMDSTITEYKALLEGQFSKVETPFVFIARDAETYALMRNMVEGLPASSTVDFSKNVVIAAFAGERNTGGWTVAIRPIPNKTIIDIREPRKGGMTAQVISYPFQIVLVPVNEIQPLAIEMTPTWTNKMKSYKVSKADFEYSGGIRGITKKFTAEGTIDVLTYGDKVTYKFNLSGKGADSTMKLSEMSSGVVSGGNVEIARVETGTFAEIPNAPLKVMGTATDQKLSLTFEPHPPKIADGFAARGKLEAVKTK